MNKKYFHRKLTRPSQQNELLSSDVIWNNNKIIKIFCSMSKQVCTQNTHLEHSYKLTAYFFLLNLLSCYISPLKWSGMCSIIYYWCVIIVQWCYYPCLCKEKHFKPCCQIVNLYLKLIKSHFYSKSNTHICWFVQRINLVALWLWFN
jgi:hypothetical protein